MGPVHVDFNFGKGDYGRLRDPIYVDLCFGELWDPVYVDLNFGGWGSASVDFKLWRSKAAVNNSGAQIKLLAGAMLGGCGGCAPIYARCLALMRLMARQRAVFCSVVL